MPTNTTLPNGLTIAERNRYETEFVYREIFVEQMYTRAFRDMPAAPVVIDVGANIGLFSLFIKQHFPAAHILAFEPAPELYQLAARNLAAYRDVSLSACGLGAQPGKQTLTYYPHYSLLSGFHGNASADAALLRAGILEQLQHKEDAGRYLELLSEGKLDAPQQFVCDITTLSTVIASEKLSCIDLLKIDAEKAEVDVLRGITQADWPQIARVVVEAHSRPAADQVEAWLRQHYRQVDRCAQARLDQAEIFLLSAQQVQMK